MLLFEQINRLQLLHALILQEMTGTPQEFAERFYLSKRQLYYLLEELRDMGADIKYSRMNKTFYYNNIFQIDVSYKILCHNKGE